MRVNHNMQFIKELPAGAQFGELALIDNHRRRATIICLEDCDFGVLNKNDFSFILKQE